MNSYRRRRQPACPDQCLEVTFDGVARAIFREFFQSGQASDPALLVTNCAVGSDGEVTLGANHRLAGGRMFTDGRTIVDVSMTTADERFARGVRKRVGVTRALRDGDWKMLEMYHRLRTNHMTYAAGATNLAAGVLSERHFNSWGGTDSVDPLKFFTKNDGEFWFVQEAKYPGVDGDRSFTDGQYWYYLQM